MGAFRSVYRVFSLTWPASMQIYWNKTKRLHKKRVQLPQANCRDTTHFDSEDDYRTGCRNVSHCQQQLNSPIQDYVHPDDQTQPTFEMFYLLYKH